MSNENQQAVSLYVHIPFCTSKCRYCGFYSAPIKSQNPAELVDCLIAEIEQKVRCPVRTVYIGGGTPSCLPLPLLKKLLGSINDRFTGGEFTVEVNPHHVNQPLLEELPGCGVNRLSIGAQSFNDDELGFLGRIHSAEDVANAVKSAHGAGFENISLDLIFAIPGSTLVSWKQSLKKAVDLNVRHISAYSLSYEQATPLWEDLDLGRITAVNENLDLAMYETAIDALAAAGFEHYEISNFAQPGFGCIHNIACWQNQPYIGIGPSAASYYNGVRWSNAADIHAYIRSIKTGQSPVAQSSTPSAVETACQTAVLNLRMTTGICPADFRRQTGFDAMQLFREPIEKYRQSGLLKVTADRICLTRRALAIADTVLCDFSDA